MMTKSLSVLALLISGISAANALPLTALKFEELTDVIPTDYIRFQAAGGILATVDETGAGLGDQKVNLTFMEDLFPNGSISETNWLALNLPALTDTGFMSFSGIIMSGAPACLGGCSGTNIFSQALTSGTFALYGSDNSTLLLSGAFSSGSLTGRLNTPTADAVVDWPVIATSNVLFTSGALLSYIAPAPSALNFSLKDVKSGGSATVTGFQVDGTGFLKGFVANGHDGDIAASTPRPDINVPEPDSVALLGIGLLGLGFTSIRRRRR